MQIELFKPSVQLSLLMTRHGYHLPAVGWSVIVLGLQREMPVRDVGSWTYSTAGVEPLYIGASGHSVQLCGWVGEAQDRRLSNHRST